MIKFFRDGNWWDLTIGRFLLSYWTPPFWKWEYENRKAPGYYGWRFGPFFLRIKRAAIVWGKE